MLLEGLQQGITYYWTYPACSIFREICFGFSLEYLRNWAQTYWGRKDKYRKSIQRDWSRVCCWTRVCGNLIPTKIKSSMDTFGAEGGASWINTTHETAIYHFETDHSQTNVRSPGGDITQKFSQVAARNLRPPLSVVDDTKLLFSRKNV